MRLPILILSILAFAKLSMAGFMVGEVPSYNCEGLYCYGGWSLPACIVVDQSGKNVERVELLSSSSHEPAYLIGYTNLANKEAVVSYSSDCLGDQSYKECLIVSILSDGCTPEVTKKFLLGSGDGFYYEEYKITSLGDKLLIALDVSDSEGFKETLILELDPQLNILRKISFPSSVGRLVEMDGRWLIFESSEEYSILDISRGILFNEAVDLPGYNYYLSDAYTTDDGGLVLFFSSSSGLSGTFEAYILTYREDGDTLRELKRIELDFLDYNSPGFPYFEKVGRCGSGWEMMLGLWEDFGGKIHQIIATAPKDFSNLRFYAIKGSHYRRWPSLGEDEEGFYLDDLPTLVDDKGCTYLAFGIDSGISAVSLEALPLESQEEGIRTSELEINASFNGTPFTLQEDKLVEIKECGEECLEFKWDEEPVNIGIVKDPTWFYLVEEPGEDNVNGKFFCYGPPGYKVYCGIVLNNDVWIYDSESGFRRFQTDLMDQYNPFYGIDTPSFLFSAPLCSEDGAELPEMDIWLFAAAIPEDESLSTSLERGDMLFTIVPWRTPDCR